MSELKTQGVDQAQCILASIQMLEIQHEKIVALTAERDQLTQQVEELKAMQVDLKAAFGNQIHQMLVEASGNSAENGYHNEAVAMRDAADLVYVEIERRKVTKDGE